MVMKMLSSEVYQPIKAEYHSILHKNYNVNILLKIKGAKDITETTDVSASYGIGKFGHHVNAQFLLCTSCFWCASYIIYKDSTTAAELPIACPLCLGGKIESIPIAKNEGYRFDYNI